MPTNLIERLPSELKDRSKGTTQVAIVRDVRVRFDESDDDLEIRVVFTFVLADPPEGTDTWPVDELWKLRSIAREVVSSAIGKALEKAAANANVPDSLRFSWSVEFEPENMPPISSDDEQIDF